MAGVKHSKRPNREPGSVNGHLPGSRAAAVADSAGGETATAAPVKKSAKADPQAKAKRGSSDLTTAQRRQQRRKRRLYACAW